MEKIAKLVIDFNNPVYTAVLHLESGNDYLRIMRRADTVIEIFFENWQSYNEIELDALLKMLTSIINYYQLMR